MKIISATDAKTNFGKCLSNAMSEPIIISKTGTETVVMLSKKEFDTLQTVQDAYWGLRATLAEEKGYIGVKEAQRIIKNLQDA